MFYRSQVDLKRWVKKAIKSCLWLPDKMWAFFGPNTTHNYLALSVLDKACVRICLSSICFFDQALFTLHEPWYKQTCVHRYEVSTKSRVLIQKQSQPIVFQFLVGCEFWVEVPSEFPELDFCGIF